MYCYLIWKSPGFVQRPNLSILGSSPAFILISLNETHSRRGKGGALRGSFVKIRGDYSPSLPPLPSLDHHWKEEAAGKFIVLTYSSSSSPSSMSSSSLSFSGSTLGMGRMTKFSQWERRSRQGLKTNKSKDVQEIPAVWIYLRENKVQKLFWF